MVGKNYDDNKRDNDNEIILSQEYDRKIVT